MNNMFQSGEYVADNVTELDDSSISSEAIQTHGVELGIDKIYRLHGNSYISNDGYVKPIRNKVSINSGSSDDELEDVDGVREDVLKEPHYTLPQGNYVVKYDKKIHIPIDTVGFVFPRSRLMRSGVEVTTAVWESGYKGVGEGGLYVDNETILAEDTRIAQLVMARATVHDTYSGSHQGENLADYTE